MRHKDPELMNRIKVYIADYYLEHEGNLPSTTQIANEVGIVRSTAYNYLVAMDKEGIIKYKDGKISSTDLDKILVGRSTADHLENQIACGDPTLEEANLLYRTTLPTAIFGSGPFFILRAKGDSMVDEGIEEGDLLVIRKNARPHVGDIIVALDEEQQNTLKVYGGIDEESHRAILEYRNEAVYGSKVILVRELVCQGVLSHVIKEK